MTTDCAAIHENVVHLLSAAGVTFSVRYQGETEKTDGVRGKPWKCDAWRFTFSAPSKRAEHSGDYFTGLGLRKAPAGLTQAPSAADILHSLALDSTAADMNFADWCAEYGYSDDSISALETYRQCCRIAKGLQRVFDLPTLEALRDAVQDL